MKIIRIMIWLVLPQLAWADEAVSVALPECSVRLERRDAEETVLMARSDCHLPLTSLAQLLDEGLAGLFPEHALGKIRSIYLGRLMNYPDWSKSLAIAAAKSVSWDARRGRPRKHGESYNHRVTKLLNSEAYPQVLKPVFSRYGLTACIADVEKVLVYEAREIFLESKDKLKKISPAARLPVDAQLWLRLEPFAANCAKD